LDWVRLADQAGFDTLSSLHRPNYDMWDPLASLAAAAAVTQRIRLATTTLPLPNRNEVLVAKQACDCWLEWRLVELARWRAQGTDTWHGLRFFERWAGDDVVEALGPTFASYDSQDIGRALCATGELFGKLEDDVASRFGLSASVDREEVLRRLDELLV